MARTPATPCDEDHYARERMTKIAARLSWAYISLADDIRFPEFDWTEFGITSTSINRQLTEAADKPTPIVVALANSWRNEYNRVLHQLHPEAFT